MELEGKTIPKYRQNFSERKIGFSFSITIGVEKTIDYYFTLLNSFLYISTAFNETFHYSD